jgi:hypothetical protein
MTGRVEEDPKSRARLDFSFSGTHGQRLCLGCIEIVDVEVEVRLLRGVRCSATPVADGRVRVGKRARHRPSLRNCTQSSLSSSISWPVMAL